MRRILKFGIFALSVIIVAPLIIISWLESRLTGGELLFSLASQSLAMVPGFIGRLMRGAFYFGALESCSWETHIGFGTLFTHRGTFVGSRVSLGVYCVVGHAKIGSDVMVGSRVSIPSGKRQHLDEEGRLATITRFDSVSIGGNSWIGEGAIIMADIGNGCIVSAGAVVVQPMPGGSLIGGNPAKIIRDLSCAVSQAS